MEDRIRVRRGQRYQSRESFWSADSVAAREIMEPFVNDGFESSGARPRFSPPSPPRMARRGEAPSSVWTYSARIPPGMSRGSQTAHIDPDPNKPSGFGGGALALAARMLVNALLSLVTLGLYTPWGMCALWRWESDGTVLTGYSTRFTGTGEELFSRWMLWTLPLYAAVLAVSAAALFVPRALAPTYVIAAPFAIAYAVWLRVRLLSWRIERTFICR